jgi:hypothetical protein
MNYQIASVILIIMYFIVGIWVELHEEEARLSQVLGMGTSFGLVGTALMSAENIFILGQG